MVMWLVEFYGGSVGVSSKEGDGIFFIVWLLLCEGIVQVVDVLMQFFRVLFLMCSGEDDWVLVIEDDD